MFETGMKFEKPIISSDKKKTFILITLIAFILFASFFGYLEYQEYQGRQHYPIVKSEFNQIQPLPNAVPTSDNQGSVAANSATVGMLYQTNMSYNEVKEYYDAELARNGFKLQKESEAYGQKRALYSKGELTGFIDYAGVTNPEYTYYFCVYWNSQ
jgi:hypothetical protein